MRRIERHRVRQCQRAASNKAREREEKNNMVFDLADGMCCVDSIVFVRVCRGGIPPNWLVCTPSSRVINLIKIFWAQTKRICIMRVPTLSQFENLPRGPKSFYARFFVFFFLRVFVCLSPHWRVTIVPFQFNDEFFIRTDNKCLYRFYLWWTCGCNWFCNYRWKMSNNCSWQTRPPSNRRRYILVKRCRNIRLENYE